MRPRILILGAGGFLGGAVRRALLEEDFGDVTLHFRRPECADEQLHTGSEARVLDFHDATVAECIEMFDALAPDVVINCVGLLSGCPEELRDTNVTIVQKLIEALEGRTRVHLIHIGSGAEYGSQRRGTAVSECAFATPLSAYGVTKFHATECLLAAAAERRLTVTVVRVFNAVGRCSPVRTLPGRAAQQMLSALEEGRSTIRLGSLDAYRDYVDTRDVVRAILSASVAPPAGGYVLNVGRGEAVLTRDLVASLASIAGYSGAVDESEGGSSRSARLSWQCADISTIRERLGWEPRYTVEDSLRDLWDEAANGLKHGMSLTP
jgi:nucleoside-diphosphate-sugar epimerase